MACCPAERVELAREEREFAVFLGRGALPYNVWM
jgi:hypothetical protein